MEAHLKQQPRRCLCSPHPRFSRPGGEEGEEVTPGFQGQPLETHPRGHKGSFPQGPTLGRSSQLRYEPAQECPGASGLRGKVDQRQRKPPPARRTALPAEGLRVPRPWELLGPALVRQQPSKHPPPEVTRPGSPRGARSDSPSLLLGGAPSPGARGGGGWPWVQPIQPTTEVSRKRRRVGLTGEHLPLQDQSCHGQVPSPGPRRALDSGQPQDQDSDDVAHGRGG